MQTLVISKRLLIAFIETLSGVFSCIKECPKACEHDQTAL